MSLLGRGGGWVQQAWRQSPDGVNRTVGRGMELQLHVRLPSSAKGALLEAHPLFLRWLGPVATNQGILQMLVFGYTRKCKASPTCVLLSSEYLLNIKYRSSRFNSISASTSPEISIGKPHDESIGSICRWTRSPAVVRTTKFIRQDGTPLKKVNYDIFIRPVLIDRDSEGKLHHYYADIVKTDADEESRATFQPLEIAKFLPALFSSGMVDFNYSEFETIDLGGVSKVILAFEATGTRPQRRILRVRE
ncbi:hypothetical protein ACJZ2D_000742 [Fusarium nematophilum]